MGINHLQLSTNLIAFLYPESLVSGTELGNHVKPALKTNAVAGKDPFYPFMGKNRSSICYLVDYPDIEFISDKQLIFLQKILAACKMTLDDIALININRHPVEINSLKKQLNPRIIFLWGSPAPIAGVLQEFPDMVISTWENISVLPVLQTDLMSMDNPEGVALKRSLWICLKKLFNL